MISETDHQKQILRQKLRQARRQPTFRQNRLVRDKMAHLVREAKPSSVALVWPLEREIDLRPLFHLFHKAKIHVFLPYTTPKGRALIFRQWYPGVKMRKGRFGTSYPVGPVGCPDIIFVPLLAFDHLGKRLGYGGGYYDRTLAVHSEAKAIGFALSCQEEKDIPIDRFDEKLEAIITENEFIKFHS